MSRPAYEAGLGLLITGSIFLATGVVFLALGGAEAADLQHQHERRGLDCSESIGSHLDNCWYSWYLAPGVGATATGGALSIAGLLMMIFDNLREPNVEVTERVEEDSEGSSE